MQIFRGGGVDILRVAIIDDDKACRDLMVSYIRRYEEENREKIDVLLFENGLDFISDYKSDCDVAFLDVEMPLTDGLTAAKKIREFDNTLAIVFVTNFAQYAINGYEVSAVDYVMKPISYFAFCAKLKKAIGFSRRSREREVLIRHGYSVVRLPISKIYYISADKNYVIYHTSEGEFRERSPMTGVRERFAGLGFAACTSGCLVNLAHVQKVSAHEVYVKDEALPISRPQKKKFMDTYIDFLSGGAG